MFNKVITVTTINITLIVSIATAISIKSECLAKLSELTGPETITGTAFDWSA